MEALPGRPRLPHRGAWPLVFGALPPAARAGPAAGAARQHSWRRLFPLRRYWMLNHPTVDRLRDLGLIGMVHALEEQRRQPDSVQLSFEDRLAMLVDREVLERDNKRLKTRLRFAGLRQVAAPEDVDYRAHRGLDRGMFQRLAQGDWFFTDHR